MSLTTVQFYVPPANPAIDRPSFRPELCAQVAAQLYEAGHTFARVKLWMGVQWHRIVRITGADDMPLTPREMKTICRMLNVYEASGRMIQRIIDEELAAYDAAQATRRAHDR